MVFSILVSLYTSRVVLQTLGVVDFGIYSVVGGVVATLNILRAPMLFGTQRFLNFELGKENFTELKRIFSMSVSIHILISIALFIIAETVGLWFLNTQMDIPANRMDAANWAYQCSIFAAIVTLMQVPYAAMITAHERIKFYAKVGIVEIILKLLIVSILLIFSIDKLKIYAVLTSGISVVVFIIYYNYCHKHFYEYRYKFIKDSVLFKKMISFVGWNITSGISVSINQQGQNILLNLLFGPVINAAQGIAYQVYNATFGILSYFQIATRPLIVQTYAKGDEKLSEFHALVARTSKFSFFLLLIFVAPLLLELPFILNIWLETVPEHTAIFSQLILISLLFQGLSSPLDTAALSTGDIKRYQIWLGAFELINLPLCYLALKLYSSSVWIYYISILLSIITLIIRVYMLKKMVRFPVEYFITKVIVKVVIVFGLTMLIAILFKQIVPLGFIGFIVVELFTMAVCGILIMLIGMTCNERTLIVSKIKKIIKYKVK